MTGVDGNQRFMTSGELLSFSQSSALSHTHTCTVSVYLDKSTFTDMPCRYLRNKLVVFEGGHPVEEGHFPRISHDHWTDDLS